MEGQSSADRHRALSLAGFRALATAAGLLQVCRELERAGVLDRAAIGRVREAMYHELMEEAPRTVGGKAEFRERLRQRLENLFSGAEHLANDPVVPIE